MIDYKELRIGNWVNDYGDVNYQVEAITKHDDSSSMGVWMNNRKTWSSTEFIHPIALTDEWLIKAGFKAKNYGYGEDAWNQWSHNNGSVTLNERRCTTFGIEVE